MSYCWQIHTLASKALVPIPQSQSQSLFFPYSHSHSSICVGLSRRVPCSRLQEMSVVESSSQYQYQQQQQQSTTTDYYPSVRDDEEGEGISKIRVPRQKHIPVSKSQLLDAIILSIQDDIDAHHFRLLTSCLDSILHAEHKTILEEMRSDYQLTDSLQQLVSNPNVKEEGNLYDYQPALDLTALLRSLDIPTKKDYDTGSRVTIATRFQRAFMQLLSNAQFEELSARDLMLTSALNTDYLLTLPVYVDWKRAYESNAIIFRRGYATEKQKGLLIVEKLDYLQSKFLRRTFFAISEPLTKLGTWISELYENASQKHEVHNWTERLRLWLKELSVFQKSLLYNDPASDEQIGEDQVPNVELPIWLAAQRAVARYEGILSPVGPR